MSLFPRSWTRRKTQLRRYVRPYGSEKPDSVGVYVHVPFCARKCPYCDFYSVAPAESGAMDSYVAATLAALSESARIRKDVAADTVYFGGGTPSLLGPERLKTLLAAVKKTFCVDKDAEVTFEANPAVTDARDLKAIKKAGFNRVSIGVQSFSDAELSALGRLHDAETAAKFVAACRGVFDNVSIDLMYGIPNQTMKSWEQSLELAAASGVDHISAYSLKIEEGTPFGENPPKSIADDDTAADMYLLAVKKLGEAGFAQYEISNFAKPGMESRHNLRYWKCREYIGFGPGAHSYYGGYRYSYVKDLARYISALTEPGATDPLVDGDPEEILQRERSGEYLMLGLRLTEGIDESYYTRMYLRDFTPVESVLKKYIPDGYAEKTEVGYRLTPKGFLVSNVIIGEVLDAAGSAG